MPNGDYENVNFYLKLKHKIPNLIIVTEYAVSRIKEANRKENNKLQAAHITKNLMPQVKQ